LKFNHSPSTQSDIVGGSSFIIWCYLRRIIGIEKKKSKDITSSIN